MRRVVGVLCVAVVGWLGSTGAAELGTSFTYQGRLRLEGLPLNEPCDLQFGLWTAVEGGSQVGTAVAVLGVLPAGGEFAADLDFGPGAFTGEARFLEVAVRCPAGGGGYTTLAPRQPLLASPYALYAPAAGEAASALSAPWTGIGGLPAGFADGVDNDTQYSAGSGLQLTGTTLSIPSQGVQNGMLANNAVTTGKIQDGSVAKADLAASGGVEGQVLKLGGGGALTWEDDGLKIPFSKSENLTGSLLNLINLNSGNYGAIYAASHGYTIQGATDAQDCSGVLGENSSGQGPNAFGVMGFASQGTGVYGKCTINGYGVYGQYFTDNNYGYLGTKNYGAYGKHGPSTNFGFLGSNSYGVYGEHNNSGNYGYVGSGDYGVYGRHLATENFGYLGSSGWGVYGSTGDNTAVGYMGGEDGVYGRVTAGLANRYAGYFNGPVYVKGLLTKAGGGFKIDHPLDPAGQYLSHSFVESPDMKNVYDGVVVLDDRGEAEVALPEWFETLNRDFRYQLTCIGGAALVYIAEEISGNRFRIAGGSPGLKVSWQVTGIRRDAWAEANRLVVEEDKPAGEQGRYMHPELYGQPAEKAIDRELGRPPKPARPVSPSDAATTATPGQETR